MKNVNGPTNSNQFKIHESKNKQNPKQEQIAIIDSHDQNPSVVVTEPTRIQKPNGTNSNQFKIHKSKNKQKQKQNTKQEQIAIIDSFLSEMNFVHPVANFQDNTICHCIKSNNCADKSKNTRKKNVFACLFPWI